MIPLKWKLIAAAVIAGTIALCLTLQQLDAGERAKVELRVHRNQAEAAAASGKDAVEALGTQAAAEGTIDIVTKGNADAIRNAPGADAPVDPALRDAALAGLCKRPAYRGSKQCLQFAPAQ